MEAEKNPAGQGAGEDRPMRADARRNEDALLAAAKAVFAAQGVDAPVRDIAAAAGVGVATLYRRFPGRADLVAAVFRHEVDTCAEAAGALAAEHPPLEALRRWLTLYTGFIATKAGLSKALHSRDPAFAPLPAYFESRLAPALAGLLRSAAEAGDIRGDVEAFDLLRALGNLSVPPRHEGDGHTGRMLGLLIDGLRFGAGA
ncbi:TetR family transcriptional regulator [Frigidibacter albus]|uniref:TetR family transcriptional regulator n=1 Tax=Frigidibacter albus TaxID=1465486 RepID=A0A6L8VFK4_9RHOB|nr:TetR family transcriptional regulator [Frigidibacter albus]MZQ88974.1 TetR family transcriptional regulator [Frigidibacter albus]NBE30969.1 TetR family transcriptional regulator [Frigidibacter albus]GGH52137.1 TetR family transcriptional regulator [Frigidibacter albus]